MFLLTACAPSSTPVSASLPASAPTWTPAPAIVVDTSDYPTVDALRNADIPPRDPVDLARRFLGVNDLPPTPSDTRTRQVGEQQAFWITDSDANTVFQVTATLRAVGEHIYIWVDSRADVTNNVAESLAEVFDARIYESVRELWGSEPTPGIDGDPRVYALFAYDLAAGVGGYFSSMNLYPDEIQPGSNEYEMFVFSLDSFGTNISDLSVQSVLGHEFQHMIRSNIDDNEDTWMDEGFSMFTEWYLAYPNALGAVGSFLASPRTQLNTWSENGPRAPHYGAAMLFFEYFFERYGLEMLQTLSNDPTSGMTAVENTIGAEETRALLADWTLANVFMLPETGYGYYAVPEGTFTGITPLTTITQYPATTNGVGIQYAADTYELSNVGDAQTLDISLTMAQTTPLIDTTAPSGEWLMYSNKADNSDTTLTRAFDLSGVTSATLNYRVWVYLEEFWDYGYLTVSNDDGATWQTLSTEHTTPENPHETAYGAGYTGQSFVWWNESVSLDAYAGQQILVRFEVLTDDSISQPGMAIDDVAIPEISYSEDFENGGGDWQAAGWLRTDNRLPQQAWVQVAQQVGDSLEVARWLFPDEGAAWSVPLEQGASRVVLVVFPFTPLTIVPVEYTLSVQAR